MVDHLRPTIHYGPATIASISRRIICLRAMRTATHHRANMPTFIFMNCRLFRRRRHRMCERLRGLRNSVMVADMRVPLNSQKTASMASCFTRKHYQKRVTFCITFMTRYRHRRFHPVLFHRRNCHYYSYQPTTILS